MSQISLAGLATAQLHRWLKSPNPPGAGVKALAIDSLGRVYLGTEHSGLFTSTDAGRSWSRLSIGMDGAVDTVGSPGPVPKTVNVITVAPSGKVYIGTDSGVFRIDPKTLHSDFFPNGVDPSGCTSLVVASDGTLFSVTQHGYVNQSAAGELGWFTYYEPWIFNRLAISNKGTLIASTIAGDLLRSTDRGESWNGIPSAQQFVNSATLLGGCGSTFVVSTLSQDTYISTDDGLTWSLLDSNSSANSALVSHDGKGPIFLIGDFGVKETTDFGKTWQNKNLPTSLSIDAFLPLSETHALSGAVTSSLLATTDGTNWSISNKWV